MSKYHKNNDPRKLAVRYPCKCSKCKTELVRGALAYYWPSSRELFCIPCGDASYRSFLESVQDEEVYNSWY